MLITLQILHYNLKKIRKSNANFYPVQPNYTPIVIPYNTVLVQEQNLKGRVRVVDLFSVYPVNFSNAGSLSSSLMHHHQTPQP